MAAETNILSPSITNADASPVVANSTGQGAGSRLHAVDDIAPVSATPIQSVGSYYRICRFPVEAIVKKVYVQQNTEFDTYSSGATLVFDFNVAFSDSTVDGTPAALQGLIPTTALGGATTSFAAYSSPNLIFGQITQVYNAIMSKDITFNGITSTFTMKLVVMQPLWLTFGFANPYGVSGDPGGFFDLTAYASTGAHTGAAGSLYGRVEYSIP